MTEDELQRVKLQFGILGIDPNLNRAVEVAVEVAKTDLSVLVTGESGAGKEKFPQIIHNNSRRKSKKYIAVNCGAIPEGTIDSELFGHEKGAFTGAISERRGYFEEADGGTIFLDEVGEMPLSTQARLLRVLESGEYIRVGSSKVQKTDVRVVAATNIDFQKAIAEHKFRQDLYYRLNTVPIHIPPLRERKTDILMLFRKFSNDFAEGIQRPSVRLTPEAENVLLQYPFPGNVRELKSIAEQISILEHTQSIDKETLLRYLPAPLVTNNLPTFVGGASQQNSDGGMSSGEREVLYQVLSDMRKDMNDLKKLVYNIISKNPVDITPEDMQAFSKFDHNDATTNYTVTPSSPVAQPVETATASNSVVIDTSVSPASPTITSAKVQHNGNIQDTDIYVEDESKSLEDMEREMIKLALERHHNKRKLAAADLKISERTLYRKIKEYGLE